MAIPVEFCRMPRNMYWFRKSKLPVMVSAPGFGSAGSAAACAHARVPASPNIRVAAATTVVVRRTPRIENISLLLSAPSPSSRQHTFTPHDSLTVHRRRRAAQLSHQQDSGQISLLRGGARRQDLLGNTLYTRDHMGTSTRHLCSLDSVSVRLRRFQWRDRLPRPPGRGAFHPP